LVTFFQGHPPLVFDGTTGTSLGFLLRCSDAKLLRLIPDESTTDRLTDNKGKDLLEQSGHPVATEWREMPGDREFDPGMVVQFHTAENPTSNASRLAILGRLQVQVSDGVLPRDIVGVGLETGWADPGGLDLKIVNIGAPTLTVPTPGQFAVTFKASDATAQVLAEIQFLDSKNNQLTPGMLEVPDGAGSIVFEFMFPEPLATATLRLRIWSNVRKVEVLVKAAIRLAFQAIN